MHQRRDQAPIQALIRRQFRRHELGGELRHRHQLGTDLLRQRLDELHHFFLEQPRHQPFATPDRNLVELGERHGHRHPVARRTRFEMVSQFEIDAAKSETRRKRLGGHARRLMTHQVFAFEVQQTRIFALGLLAPFFEIGAVGDALRNQAVVKGDNQFVVDQHVGAA